MYLSMTESRRAIPDWETLYKNQQVESMPWYNENLDADLEEELEKRKINQGKFLDLGTGPGTQAIKLHERGLSVTATDLSETAIKKAQSIYNSNNNNSKKVDFRVDNILNSNLKENEFDYIFDRGCFHVISTNDRKRYIMQVTRILKDNGILFLKCFSDKEQGEEGPHRFSKDKLKEIFENENFNIENMKETVYQGTLNPLPKALFAVMTKQNKMAALGNNNLG
jgi:cyclopropane fatty-acyl-phospholipid synthase-like methyltransferase